MTVAERTWTSAVGTPRDHPAIADFLATTDGLGGRKFSADSRDVAEQLESSLPGAVIVVRDHTGRVRGYAAVHQPHGTEPEIIADLMFDPATPQLVVDAAVERFRREAVTTSGAFLRGVRLRAGVGVHGGRGAGGGAQRAHRLHRRAPGPAAPRHR